MLSVALLCANPTHSWIFQARRRQPIPMRKNGVFSVAYGVWGSAQWWVSQSGHGIRELGMGEAEDGKVMGPRDEGRKRRRRHSVGDVERMCNPEEAGDSGDEGEVPQDEGDL